MGEQQGEQQPEKENVFPDDAQLAAADALTALSEELGLYDEPAGAVPGAPGQGCPFCGARLPCAGHGQGG